MAPLRRSWLWILGTATALAVVAAAVNSSARALLTDAPRADEITLVAARSLPAPVIWIDARPAPEFATDHLPEALPLTLEDWDEQIVAIIAQWQPGVPVIVYCDDRACAASHHVADKLRQEYQFDDVRVLHGGWRAWQEALHR